MSNVIPTPETLTLLADLTNRYADVENLWGPYGRRGRGIIFEPSGALRMANIAGYILGVAEAGQLELASKMADEIVQQMDRLATYGGYVEHVNWDKDTQKMPQYLVKICDDGTRHGFGLLWFLYLGDQDLESVQKRRAAQPGRFLDFDGRWGKVPYGFSHNGGLLYHGLGDNSLSVTLTSDYLWSIHT
jgi:hypothetical protein